MTAGTNLTPVLDRFPRVSAYLDKYAAGLGSDPTVAATDLTATLDRVEVRDTPFVVATVDDFLPADLYQQVLRAWDSIELQAVDLPGAKYVGSRKGAQLVKWEAGAISPAPPTVWDTVAAAAGSASFVRSLFARFAPTVEAHLAEPDLDAADQPGFVLWANCDHGPDEALGAHLDGAHKLLTIVLYLDLAGPTTADSQRLWGTTLYDSHPGKVRPVQFSTNASHAPAGHVEFRPNRAFIMPNANTALHGVAGGQEGVTRRSLMWGYWYFSPTR